MKEKILNYEFSPDKIFLLLLGLVVSLIPLAVRAIPVNSGTYVASWSSQSQFIKTYDVFFLVKTYLLFLFVGMLAVLFILALRRQLVSVNTSPIIPLAYILGLLIIGSGYLSLYPSVAFFGFFDRYEGVFVFCAYIILMIITASIIQQDHQLRILLFIIGISSIGISVIAVFQFIGYDVFNYTFLQKFWVSKELTGALNFKYGNYVAYGTLYNPNYLSGYMGMVVFLPLVAYLYSLSLWRKGILLVAALLFWTALLASKSSSGFVAMLVCITLLTIFLYMKRRRLLIQLLIFMVGCSVIFLGMNAISKGLLENEFSSVFRYTGKLVSMFSSQVIDGKEQSVRSGLAGVGTAEPGMSEVLAYYPRVREVDRLGSNRGYIWQKTLTMIKKKPFIGYGMDTFSFHFPQGDLNNYYVFNKLTVLVDKPHSFYLQIAVGAGVIALFIFLVINYIVGIKVGKRIWQDFFSGTENSYLLLAVYLAWLSYLIQGVFNDSTVGTSTLYWFFLGVLVAYSNKELTFISTSGSFPK